MARILIVDDETSMRRVLTIILREDSHEIVDASGVSEAKAALLREPFDAVITDQRMRDGKGLDVLAFGKEIDPSMPVILITAYATVELAVEAMQRGAFDFITKPFQADAIRACLRRAAERTALVRENAVLRQEYRRSHEDEIIGESGGIRSVRDQIARVAPTNATVLILGETGTGKELVARAIHRMSSRSAKPFVAVNCAAMTETLLESELFGHEKGSFTGADRSRPGLFEAAHTGTLFLDEAGEMPLSLQAKMLRVLMDGEFTRVGANQPRRVDVRVIAATHRNLEDRIAEKSFREDLYYRLAVFPIKVPPLRERRSDIPLLAAHLQKRIAANIGLAPLPLTPTAMERLTAYDFPGNIRELRNLLERALILASGGAITGEQIPTGSSTSRATDIEALYTQLTSGEVPDLRALLDHIEQQLIVRALDDASGVQARAARLLGISKSDLSYKLKKYGMLGGS